MGLFDKKITGSPEFAQVINWIPAWDTGAPMPQVFSNGHKTYLIYLIHEIDPAWTGNTITLIDPRSEINYPLALVEFDGQTFRFGIANDEVFDGLPLSDQGLEPYAAHVIENSSWIKELKSIHQVHPYYKEERWNDLKHFSLLFHDEIFEVIAKDFKIETFNTTFGQLAMEVVRRMNTN